jgi:hypothetical protein
MSLKAITWAFEQDLTPSPCKFVLVALADHADAQTGECWPAIAFIAKRCCMGERSVFRHLERLEKLGKIGRVNRWGRSSLYRLLIDGDPAKLAPSHPATVAPYPAKLAPSPANLAPRTVTEPSKESRDIPKSKLNGESVPSLPKRTVNKEFLEFYEDYPNKKAKKAALKAYQKARTETSHSEIMEGLRRAKASRQWRDPQYIPHPATWLNQGRWEDQEATSRKAEALV